jgi:hypothetical protein
MNSQRRASTILCVCSIALFTTAWHDAQAGFNQTNSFPITVGGVGPHGIAFDGTQWHIANTGSNIVSNYDASFNHLSDITVSGVADLRGLTYDSSTGNLFVGDDQTNVVRRVTLAGVVLSSFQGASSGLNALAYDSDSDSLWLAYFSNGLIENRTKTGTLISSFSDPSYQWTGLAYDSINHTLLALETDDALREYRLNGNTLGTVIPSDVINGNGQGLAYIASTGTLYVTSQIPNVITVFSDPARQVPEASTGLLLAIGVITFGVISNRMRRGLKIPQ